MIEFYFCLFLLSPWNSSKLLLPYFRSFLSIVVNLSHNNFVSKSAFYIKQVIALNKSNKAFLIPEQEHIPSGVKNVLSEEFRKISSMVEE